MALDKKYDHKVVEEGRYDIWKKEGDAEEKGN